jgi:hypothetical protein
MNGLNAVYVVCIPAVNQVECCGMKSTLPVTKHTRIAGEPKKLVPVNKKANNS